MYVITGIAKRRIPLAKITNFRDTLFIAGELFFLNLILTILFVILFGFAEQLLYELEGVVEFLSVYYADTLSGKS